MNLALIDYGTGNLHSLGKALEAGGARVTLERDARGVRAADAIVLPGVGAFGAASTQLAATASYLQSAIAEGKPCLGICLGMQLLFESSDEGMGPGLGVINGRVRRLHGRRVPHMGWNEVHMMDDVLFAGLPQLIAYYANGFAVEPDDPSEVIGWTSYGGEQFPAAVRRDNIWGVQFHPEKSGTPGLRLLRNFVDQVRQ